jgi:hypothetical protein
MERLGARLLMLEEDAKPAARRTLQDSQNRSASVLRWGSLGGGYAPSEMRLGRWVSCAESASLLRQRPAHRATD